MLDRTGQRIVGVLIEKELTVPDSYPLTENSLLLGCNQKSNRDPEMNLEEFVVRGALMQLRLQGWVTQREGGRAERFKHEIESKLGVDAAAKALLAELLLRGPQTPTELRTRCARMGLHRDVAGIESLLRELAARQPKPLVELLPRRPRERDARWTHLLGPVDVASPAASERPSASPTSSVVHADPIPTPDHDPQDPLARIARLEAQVADLTRRLDALTG